MLRRSEESVITGYIWYIWMWHTQTDRHKISPIYRDPIGSNNSKRGRLRQIMPSQIQPDFKLHDEEEKNREKKCSFVIF